MPKWQGGVPRVNYSFRRPISLQPLGITLHISTEISRQITVYAMAAATVRKAVTSFTDVVFPGSSNYHGLNTPQLSRSGMYLQTCNIWPFINSLFKNNNAKKCNLTCLHLFTMPGARRGVPRRLGGGGTRWRSCIDSWLCVVCDRLFSTSSYRVLDLSLFYSAHSIKWLFCIYYYYY